MSPDTSVTVLHRALYWTAYVLSALGIAFGLSSARVVGAAREIHLVLVPLAAIGWPILAWRRIASVMHTSSHDNSGT